MSATAAFCVAVSSAPLTPAAHGRPKSLRPTAGAVLPSLDSSGSSSSSARVGVGAAGADVVAVAVDVDVVAEEDEKEKEEGEEEVGTAPEASAEVRLLLSEDSKELAW